MRRVVQKTRFKLSQWLFMLGIWVVGDEYVKSRIRMGLDLAGNMMLAEYKAFNEELETPEDDDETDLA